MINDLLAWWTFITGLISPGIWNKNLREWVPIYCIKCAQTKCCPLHWHILTIRTTLSDWEDWQHEGCGFYSMIHSHNKDYFVRLKTSNNKGAGSIPLHILIIWSTLPDWEDRRLAARRVRVLFRYKWFFFFCFCYCSKNAQAAWPSENW